MNIPALMTPNSAVTASNMAKSLGPSGHDLTARLPTQSKEFGEKPDFESGLMILCNTLHRVGTTRRPAAIDPAGFRRLGFAIRCGAVPSETAREKCQPLRFSHSRGDRLLLRWIRAFGGDRVGIGLERYYE